MPKRLVVIGGTAAGLSAATKAKRIIPELEVTVFEKTGYTSYGSCGLPYFVGGMIKSADDLVELDTAALSQKRGITANVRHEVTSIDRLAKEVHVKSLADSAAFTAPYDQLVIATGALPVTPNIPGIHAEGVHFLRTVEDGIALRARAEKTKSAVIIGGGLIGLEVAEQLALTGCVVTVLEAMPRFLPHLDESFSGAVRAAMEQNGVAVHTCAAVNEIAESGGAVRGVRTGGGECFPADLVLVSVGVRPNSALAEQAGLETGFRGGIVTNRHMQTSDPSIWACGDCVQMYHLLTGQPCYVPAGTTANKQGKVAGVNIAGGHAAFDGVLASQVTEVFGLVAASTGLSVQQAADAGYAPATAAITKRDRASYYPGGSDNRLMLVFDRNSGVLLGAQGIGGKSVAGRVNVLVTAITCGMTVEQLGALDLVYAPPVAPVYDPILIAAAQAAKQVKPSNPPH